MSHFHYPGSGAMSSKGAAAETLTTAIKALESAFEPILPAEKPFIIRLDGVSFKRFTRGLEKPFDFDFTRALIGCTAELMERTNSRTGFCQSDEITLVYPGDPENKMLLYNGRVQKIASVVAGMASALFSKRLASDLVPYFDARVFAAPDEETAADVVYWRHAMDCRRNAINQIAHRFVPEKRLKGMGIAEAMHVLKAEFNVDIGSFPQENIYGCFFKRVEVPHVGFNPITKERVNTVRTRIQARSFDWTEKDRRLRASLIMARLWPLDQSNHKLVDFSEATKALAR